MFKRRKKKKKKDRFRSKYMDLDFKNMSDEEFDEISKKVYRAIAIRGSSGVFIFILCIIALVMCGRYLW